VALIPCPECQVKISDKAATCPHCGAPRRKSAVRKVGTVGGKVWMVASSVFQALATALGLYRPDTPPLQRQELPTPTEVSQAESPGARPADPFARHLTEDELNEMRSLTAEQRQEFDRLVVELFVRDILEQFEPSARGDVEERLRRIVGETDAQAQLELVFGMQRLETVTSLDPARRVRIAELVADLYDFLRKGPEGLGQEGAYKALGVLRQLQETGPMPPD
jgi:hypothetical protein